MLCDPRTRHFPSRAALLPSHVVESGLRAGWLSHGAIGIRPFCAGEEAALCAAARETLGELLAWMTWCRPDYGLPHAAEFIARCHKDWDKGSNFNFAIYRPNDNLLLGSVAVNRIERRHRCANLAYWVRQGHTGRGVALEASRLAVRFAFGQLNLNRLELLIPVVNLRSQRVAQKLGARLEGTLREKVVIQGTAHDAFLYALLASDAAARFPEP